MPAPQGENVTAAAAGGRVLSVTSQDEGYPAAQLIDGKPGESGWASAPGGGFPQEIVFQLAHADLFRVGAVSVDPRTGYPALVAARWPKEIEVEVATEGTQPGDWRSVARASLEGTGEVETVRFEPVPARWVKLRVLSNQGGGHVVEMSEVEVWAVPEAPVPAPPTATPPAPAPTVPPPSAPPAVPRRPLEAVPAPSATPAPAPPPSAPTPPAETPPAAEEVTPPPPAITPPAPPPEAVPPPTEAVPPPGPPPAPAPVSEAPPSPTEVVPPSAELGPSPAPAPAPLPAPEAPPAPAELAPPPGGPTPPAPTPEGVPAPAALAPPPAPVPAAPAGSLANLALASGGAKITASSYVTDDYAPTRVIDGAKSESSIWTSRERPAYPQDLVVELPGGKTYRVSRVVVSTNTGPAELFGARWPRQVEVSVSMAGNTDADFTRVAGAELPQTTEDHSIDFEPVEARYVKLRILSNHGHAVFVEFSELEVWGDPGSGVSMAPELPEIPSEVPRTPSGEVDVDALIQRLETVLQQLRAYRAATAPSAQ